MNTNLALNHVTVQTSSTCPKGREAKQPDISLGHLTSPVNHFLLPVHCRLFWCLLYMFATLESDAFFFSNRYMGPPWQLVWSPFTWAHAIKSTRCLKPSHPVKILNVVVARAPPPVPLVWLPACLSGAGSFWLADQSDVNAVWKGYGDGQESRASRRGFMLWQTVLIHCNRLHCKTSVD